METDLPIIERRGKRYFFRLSEMHRKHHNLMFLLMFLLFLTGFPQRFYGEWWAPRIYGLVGGPRWAPTIHRFAGLALAALFLLHLLTIIRDFAVNRLPGMRKDWTTFKSVMREVLALEMVPNMRDIRELLHHLLYLLYIKGSPPEYGRMTWREKMDYMALYRGIPVVALTGISLWQGDLLTRFIPGVLLNVAHLVHSYEVTIILLSVVGFHWYNVHYSPDKFPMSHVFITGYIPEEEMAREHYGEYLEAVKEDGISPQTSIRNRRSGPIEIFGYKLFTVTVLIFLVWFSAISLRFIFYSPPQSKDGSIPESAFHSGVIARSADNLSGCVRCHTDIPHADSDSVMEPFLNMHASFLACETCHLRGKDPAFRWCDTVTGKTVDNPTGIDFAGKRRPSGVKIVPGLVEAGGFAPLKARVVDGDLRLNKKGHTGLSKEPVGCNECHRREGGRLPLPELGYHVESLSLINGTDILAAIERYRKIAEEVRR